jgi:beta-lactamase regulating signal transducer with metallopeptidase domain
MNVVFSNSLPNLLLILACVSTGAVCLAWIATLILRKASAALRHYLWLLAVSVPLSAFPLAWLHLQIALPVLRAPGVQHAIPAFKPDDEAPPSPASAPSQGIQVPIIDAHAPTGDHTESVRLTLSLNLWWLIWSCGVLFSIGRILVSQMRLRRLVGRHSSPPPGELVLRLNTIWKLLGAPRPPGLIITRQAGVPFCHGLFHPTIILPQNWRAWDEQRIEVCLIHEAAHLVRGDLLAMVAGQLTCAICWFNPLVWLAAARLRDEAENAADDLVLSRNVPPEVYAATLVGITEECQAYGITPSMALPMAHANRLDARVVAILDSTLRRNSPGVIMRLAISLLALAALTGAMSVRLTAAGVAPDPWTAFRDFIWKRESALSNLRTFNMEGTLIITCSDEYLKEQSTGEAARLMKLQHGDLPEKVSLRNFRIWGRGDKVKEMDQVFGDNGRVKYTDTYYLEPNQLVWAQGADESQVNAFPLGRANPQNGLYNCPAFFNYAFLREISHGSGGNPYGAPALLPSDLATSGIWASLLQKVQAATFEQDGAIHVTMVTGTEGFCSLDLTPDSGSNDGYKIGAITFSNPDKSLDRKIEVLDSIHDSTLGAVGKTYRMELFNVSNEAGPGVTWDFAIKDMQLNGPVAEETVAFKDDPETSSRETLPKPAL